MDPSRENEQKPRTDDIEQAIEQRKLTRTISEHGLETNRLRRVDDASIPDDMPAQLTARDVEQGALETVTWYEDAIGKKFPDGPMGEEAARILYDLNVERQDWTQAQEDDARATLQTLYPDNGGSREHGPL